MNKENVWVSTVIGNDTTEDYHKVTWQSDRGMEEKRFDSLDAAREFARYKREAYGRSLAWKAQG